MQCVVCNSTPCGCPSLANQALLSELLHQVEGLSEEEAKKVSLKMMDIKVDKDLLFETTSKVKYETHKHFLYQQS